MSDYSQLFYPLLIRRNKYKTTNSGKFYADYHEYYLEIEEDCKRRCVYCDIFLDEIGGDGMHLDHFRPHSIPSFYHLKSNPNNLVLACPVCNILKSDIWIADVDSDLSYNEDGGFIDPFIDNRNDFFEIKNNGDINSKKIPASYIIELMKLKRASRIQLRRNRILKFETLSLVDRIGKKIEDLLNCLENDNVTVETRSQYISRCKELIEMNRLLKIMLLEWF